MAASAAFFPVVGGAGFLLPGIGPWSAFDRSYAAAQAVAETDASRGEFFGRALQAYLQVPRATAGWRARVGQAIWAAWLADDDAVGLELCRDAWAGRVRDAFVGELWLCLAERSSGDVDAALDVARDHVWNATPAVVAAFVKPRAGSVLERGGARLRSRGATEVWLFEALVAAYPEDAPSLGNLALANRHVGRVAEAKRLYEQALERAPEDEILINDYALLFKGTGQFDEALVQLRRSRGFDEQLGMGPATNNLVWLAVRGRSDAIEDPKAALQALLTLRPENAMARRSFIDLILAER